MNWGFSGVILRGSGGGGDLRKNEPYEVYSELDFRGVVGKTGDFLQRQQKMLTNQLFIVPLIYPDFLTVLDVFGRFTTP